MHYCLNLVTDNIGFASGVLIRSVEIENQDERYASGPGLVARIFQLDLNFNSLRIYSNKYLKIYDCGIKFNDKEIVTARRIGITKAADLKWRWYLKKSRSISKRQKGDKKPCKETFSKYK